MNWNEYESKIETRAADNNNVTRYTLDASFQGVNRLFFLEFGNTENGANKVERDSHRKYFLPRVSITNYNVLIDGRNFYDQPFNDQIKELISGTARAGEGFLMAGKGIKRKALMPPHPLTNVEIQEYYKNKPRFNGVYSRDNLPKTIKNGAYVINLDEYLDSGTHWIALYVKDNEITYFDSFGVEHVPKEIKKFIGQKNIKTNIFRIQADNSIMCGYFLLDLLTL